MKKISTSQELLSKIILLCVLFFSIKTFACEVTQSSSYNIAIDLSKNLQFSYFDDRMGHPSFVRIDRCQQTAQKQRYLMVGLSARRMNINSDLKDIDYRALPTLSDNKCKISNNPIPPSDEIQYKDRQDYFALQTKFLQKCVRLEFVSADSNIISFPEQPTDNSAGRPSCIITERSSSSRFYDLEGGYCFVKVIRDTNIQVRPYVAPQCLEEKFFQENNFPFLDIPATLDVYTSGSPTGLSQDLTAVSSLPMRITVMASDKKIQLSDDIGDEFPRWPISYTSQPYLGSIDIRDNGRSGTIWDLRLIINNVCNFKDGKIKQDSLCNYLSLTAARVVIKEKQLNKKNFEVIDEWYMGGVVDPQWQGLLRDRPYVGQYPMDPQSHYQMEINFDDPSESYQFLRKYYDHPGIIIQNITQNQGISPIQDINSLLAIQNLPNVGNLPPASSPGTYSALSENLDKLQEFLRYPLWPPFYEKVCQEKSGESPGCKKVQSEKNYSLLLDFQVTPSAQDPLTYDLKNAKLTRRSIFDDKVIQTDFLNARESCGN